MTQPDWQRFYAINDELQRLADSGQLNKEQFQRLWHEARVAVGPSEAGELLEALIPFAKDRDWIPGS